MTITELKKLPEEEFLKLKDATPELHKLLLNSKSGFISIKKDSDNEGYLSKNQCEWGRTDGFGEGISLHINSKDRWFRTSTIQKIDWENNRFTTLNSVYSFKFIEDGKDI